MGKVIYGLKNVHYAIYNDTTHTYGAWKSIPGAISMTADSDATQNDFYADDVVYATINATAKETGSIEFATITDEMYIDLFGYANGDDGLTYQTTEPIATTVALGYEVSGNEGKTRGVRYNVTFTAPSQSANTITDSTNPDTVTVNYTAVGRDFTIGGNVKNVLKSHCKEGSTAYTNFWGSVISPASTGKSASLSALTLQNVTLSPAFSAGTMTYTGTTTSASGTISATATDSTDAEVTILVNGSAYSSSASYSAGANMVVILVTNDTAVATYTVIVTKS